MATEREKLMAHKTKSPIPKTPTEKNRWIRARQIAVKQSGARSEGAVPWGLVNHIYQEQMKAGKTAKLSDVQKAKFSKTVKKYVTNRSRG